MTPKAPQLTENKADNLANEAIHEQLQTVGAEKMALENKVRTRYTDAPSAEATDITSTKSCNKKAVSKYEGRGVSGARRSSTASDSPGMELFLEVIEMLDELSQKRHRKSASTKSNHRNGKADAVKAERNADSSFMTSTALGGKTGKDKASKFALSEDLAQLDKLRFIEAKLMEARDKKYVFSTEQLWRLEEGISNLPADLQREYGKGMNKIEQALDGIQIKTSKPHKKGSKRFARPTHPTPSAGVQVSM